MSCQDYCLVRATQDPYQCCTCRRCHFDSATAQKDQRAHPKEGVADDDHSCYASQAHCGKEGVNLWPHPPEGLPRARGHLKACSLDQVAQRQDLVPLRSTTANACRGCAGYGPLPTRLSEQEPMQPVTA